MNTAIAITAILAILGLGNSIVTAIRDITTAKHKAMTRYPHPNGDITLLGPEIFASKDGNVICWKGENYARQTEQP